MCFFSKLTQSSSQLESRFNADFPEVNRYKKGEYSAFAFPETPVICADAPRCIRLLHWGLIPHWAKNDSIRKHTLNARVETVEQKPSFRDSINRPCLILADAFFEWQWLDIKGRRKQKYQIGLPNEDVFGFAGISSEWIHPVTGKHLETYSILTTKANALMEQIHNTKKRMPIIVPVDREVDWLGKKLSASCLEDVDVKAIPIA